MAQVHEATGDGPPRPPIESVLGANVFRNRVLRIPKMSQQELAMRAGLGLNTLQEIEAARDPGRIKRHPQVDTVESIARALGVEPSDLLRYDPEATRAFLQAHPPLRVIHGFG